MKNIPNISFENKDQTKEFELLSLSELFANKFNNNLNHNPTESTSLLY